MLIRSSFHDCLESLRDNTLHTMQTIAETKLNPSKYYLSEEAKKRLKWMYLLYYEHEESVTKASRKIGISRQWLSTLKSTFELHGRDPRSLEPKSRAPHRTNKRKRIPKEAENTILKIRDSTPGWGKEKIARILKRDYGIVVGASTVNRYLKKRHRIDPKISEKNTNAWLGKKQRERAETSQPLFKVKFRPPKQLKDLCPGALVEKDMKFIVKQGIFLNTEKHKAKENFSYQHTMTDSFTRIRALELVENAESATAVLAHQRAVKRFPFPIACENTDNGSENNGEFPQELQSNDTFHFYSSVGTPTDNPRVERSHLTDDKEFYHRGNASLPYEEQRTKLLTWERRYNEERPHQALGYLTPMEFYQLWKKDPEATHVIVKKWQAYLLNQRKRLATARKMKRKEQIEALMKFIDAKLKKTVELSSAKQSLINCQLCSWT